MAQHRNIFFGDSHKAIFARILYSMIKQRQWITYIDVIAKLRNRNIDELTYTVSKDDYYGQLRKAASFLKKTIRERVGNDCFEEVGNNRNLRFRYIGTPDDPLSDMVQAKTINDLHEYWQFCQDSAGFFPTSWLEFFFKDCQDLIDIKTKHNKGQEIMSTSSDHRLTNIDLLPILYNAISNKQVLEIVYHPAYDETTTIIFHPHYLKEYNGRWHVLGHADGLTPDIGYNVAIDRIQYTPREVYNIKYIEAPRGFYKDLFRDIVGVTHPINAQTQHIVVRVYNHYIFNLIDTKPIHQSHHIVAPFDEYPDGEYGDFSIDVVVNNELIGRLLQMGENLEVMSPLHVRQEIASRINAMAHRYAK